MVNFNKFFSTTVVSFFGTAAFAQAEVEMADTMRSSGKIYVIVAIILIVLTGLLLYLFLLDRKISKIERELLDKKK
jgi:CcmD family protein